METFTVERVIAAPVERVFDWCSVTSNYERSGWVVRDVLTRPGEGAPYGLGAVRRHTWVIGRFVERITRYDAPNAFDYVVEQSFPPARHEGGTMTFEAVPGGTRVVWSTTVEVPFGGAFVTRRIAGPVITYVFGRILRACERELVAAN